MTTLNKGDKQKIKKITEKSNNLFVNLRIRWMHINCTHTHIHLYTHQYKYTHLYKHTPIHTYLCTQPNSNENFIEQLFCPAMVNENGFLPPKKEAERESNIFSQINTVLLCVCVCVDICCCCCYWLNCASNEKSKTFQRELLTPNSAFATVFVSPSLSLFHSHNLLSHSLQICLLVYVCVRVCAWIHNENFTHSTTFDNWQPPKQQKGSTSLSYFYFPSFLLLHSPPIVTPFSLLLLLLIPLLLPSSFFFHNFATLTLKISFASRIQVNITWPKRTQALNEPRNQSGNPPPNSLFSLLLSLSFFLAHSSTSHKLALLIRSKATATCASVERTQLSRSFDGDKVFRIRNIA